MIIAGLAFLAALIIYFFGVPFSFPTNQIITVAEGLSAGEVTRALVERQVIRSRFAFGLIFRLSGKEEQIKSGDYIFERPLGVFSVIRRLTEPIFGIDQVKITVPEGLSVREMAEIFSQSLPNFDKLEFINLAGSEEGYLFPDTYFFFANATSGEVIAKMENNFRRKVSLFDEAARKSGRTLEEVVVMASLIEAEVREPEVRRIVAGILWKRLDIGMALQVDAAPPTYEFPGLPSLPITNPGLDSIEAALNPTKTEYFYYLSGSDGTTHYARTLEEHKINKEKFLR